MANIALQGHLKSKWAVLKEDVAKVKHTHTHQTHSTSVFTGDNAKTSLQH